MKNTLLSKLNISKALLLASVYHANQRRKYDGSPYINHLIEVMSLLIVVGNVTSINMICAAILHDILEDTDLAPEVLEQELNAEVLWFVKNLTGKKDSSIEQRRRAVIDKLTGNKDELKCIKLADICSNVAKIPKDWTDERVICYVDWLDEVSLLCKDANMSLYEEYLSRKEASLTARF